jgi:hypothetical protein
VVVERERRLEDSGGGFVSQLILARRKSPPFSRSAIRSNRETSPPSSFPVREACIQMHSISSYQKGSYPLVVGMLKLRSFAASWRLVLGHTPMTDATIHLRRQTPHCQESEQGRKGARIWAYKYRRCWVPSADDKITLSIIALRPVRPRHGV